MHELKAKLFKINKNNTLIVVKVYAPHMGYNE